MPMCPRCRKPFICTCHNSPPETLGATQVDCPLKQKAAVWVHVVDDRGIDIENIGAKHDGAKNPTNTSGVAVYDPVDPGGHTVDLEELSVDLLKLYEKPVGSTIRPIQVADGQIAYVPYQLKRKPLLRIKVVEKNNPSKVFGGATVTVTGAESHTKTSEQGTGIADCGRVVSGDYHVKVKLTEEDEKKYATTLDFASILQDFTLPPGREDEVIVLVEELNIVTPKIEAEYKIVLFDNKLRDKQGAGETKIQVSPTYIQATISQTNPEHPYKKTGKLEFTPANVDVFTDAECTKPLTADLTAEQLIGTPEQLMAGKVPQLWLRGKTEGKFTAKLTLADPADRFVKLDKNPTDPVNMGVVKLELKLHQQDIATIKGSGMQVDPDTDPEDTYYTNLKDKALPDPKLMTDEEKIGEPKDGDAAKPGRMLHVQDAGNFGRAKLIVTKLNSANLPDGTDDYDIVLNTGRGSAPATGGGALKPEDLQGGDKDTPKSGSLSWFDAEVDGAKKDKVSYKISALKAADQTIWVEGTTETDQPCDIRMDAGMDRDDGGLTKTVKRNGDWTRYTVVKLEEVKLLYPTPSEPTPPAAQYDSAKKEFYINFKADPAGRKVTIEAKLTKELKNVPLYFMLAPDKDNKKTANWGADLPTTWKWKDIEAGVKHLDKTDRKDFLHLTEKTDDKGKASKELTLSRFGGDKFQPAAYIEQDPHLAKYVEGHTDLAKRKPKLATDKIIVWRKFWYREVKVEGIQVADFGNAPECYKDVKTTMEAAPVITVSRSDANSFSPAVIYKKHMVRYYRDTNTNNYVNSYPGDTGDALIVGDNNESQFMGRVTADTARPVEIPIMNVHGLWIGDGNTGQISPGWQPFPSTYLSLVADKKLLDPPLQGGTLLKTGTWEAKQWDAAANSGAGAWVPATPTASGALTADMVTLDPARNDPRAVRVAVPVTPGAQVQVKVRLTLRGAASFLGTSYDDGIVNCFTPNDLVDFINTINHEIGHSFKQVAKVRPTGVPVHPNQYDRNGSHCRASADNCLMFESGPQAAPLNRFCPVCHPYVLVQVMRTT